MAYGLFTIFKFIISKEGHLKTQSYFPNKRQIESEE